LQLISQAGKLNMLQFHSIQTVLLAYPMNTPTNYRHTENVTDVPTLRVKTLTMMNLCFLLTNCLFKYAKHLQYNHNVVRIMFLMNQFYTSDILCLLVNLWSIYILYNL
jgi:hypothetical protein